MLQYWIFNPILQIKELIYYDENKKQDIQG